MIMESTNNVHHYLQDYQHAIESSTSLSTSSSFFGGIVGGTTTHSYNNTTTLNNDSNAEGNKLNQNLEEVSNERARSSMQMNENGVSPPRRPLNNSMVLQDLGYHHQQHDDWTSSSSTTTDDIAAEKYYYYSSRSSSLNSCNSSMNEEIMSVVGFPKFTEMLNSSSNTTMKKKNTINEHNNADDLMHKTLLFPPNLYPSSSSTNHQDYPIFGDATITTSRGRGNFNSQIFPRSINYISNLNHHQKLDNNLQDLFTPTSFTPAANFNHSQDHHLATFTDNNSLSFTLHHHMQHHHHPTDNSTNNITSSLFANGTADTKRPCTLIDSKPSQSQTALKKSRSSESRTPCPPPFKVRKEKLGDRIAALQQLVAPFGKTDTASVLMEAIGYIKFLQDQVETLSVPYMKPSQHNPGNRSISMQRGSESAKQDLRSRGLCLVPLSCMSYIAAGESNEVWQQQQRPN